MSDMQAVNELQEILKTMDVPKGRKWDMGWLRRNLAVRNSEHPQFARAMELVRKLEV